MTLVATGPENGANGIVLANRQQGAAKLEIYLVRSAGRWQIGLNTGDTFPADATVWNSNSESASFRVQFRDHYRQISITAPDGQTHVSRLAEAPFDPTETARLVVQTAPGGAVTIESLTMAQAPTSAYQADGLDVASLGATAAAAGSSFGAFIEHREPSPIEERMLRHHADIVTWHLRFPDDPDDPVATFREKQSQYTWAKAQGKAVRAHPLVWHLGLPAWL